jgi:hypothetical protein
MYAALSIFGNPKDLSTAGEKSATENGLVGLYLGLHNIVLGIDEASNKRPDHLSELVHRISQGKGKIRMQSSVDAMREHQQSASLLAIFTSNQSLYDKLTSLKASPDGELARLIEFHVRKPAALISEPKLGKEIFDVFRANYGHAGIEFIQHYYKVGEDHVKKLITKWGETFAFDFSNDSTYRFYENTVACALAGAELAMEAGIIKPDLKRVYKFIVLEMIMMKEGTPGLENHDYASLLGDFCNRYQSGLLILNTDRVVSEPHGPLVGRGEIHNDTLIISKTAFKKHLAEIQVSLREFEFATKKSGVLIKQDKLRLSTGWKGGVTTPPVAVYCFKSDAVGELVSGSSTTTP